MSFNKYKHLRKTSIPVKIKASSPLPIHFLTPHWQQLFWFGIANRFCSFELHTNGTIWIIFYTWIFTWHRLFELHSYWCKYEKSLFSLLHSIALHICPNNCLQILTKSSVDGHFGYFQFGPIMNNDAANIFCWSPFVYIRFSFLLDKCLSAIAGTHRSTAQFSSVFNILCSFQ